MLTDFFPIILIRPFAHNLYFPIPSFCLFMLQTFLIAVTYGDYDSLFLPPGFFGSPIMNGHVFDLFSLGDKWNKEVLKKEIYDEEII